MHHLKIQEIPIELLREHPENSNFMNAKTTHKLRRHVEQSGKYEPLTVRPYPGDEGKFQVINGHNRLRVLRALKYPTICCVVWNLDDKQTRMYLATLNRLSGKDIPERRANLLANLLQSFNVEDLTTLLPDDRKQIEQLEQLTRFDASELPKQTAIKEQSKVPVILNFILDETEAKVLNLALDFILNTDKEDLSRSQALVCLAHFYLKHHQVTTRA
jgi:hypothetical protein